MADSTASTRPSGRARGAGGGPARLSAAEAAARVRPRDMLGLPLGPGIPPDFLHALGERDDFEALRVFGALLTGLYKLFTRDGVKLLSGFYGPVERAYRAAGHDIEFVPADFRRFTPLLDRLAPRVMATQAAPPDAEGWCSLSLHAGATATELSRAGQDPERLLVVEVNPNLPRTFGLQPDYRHALHLEEIDILIESESPVFALPDAPSSEVHHAIAEHVRPFVPDGATLQTGIGAIPSQVASLLANGPGGDYGVHSEMFTDGLMRLHQAGKVTNKKGVYDGFSVCTFAAGSPELYQWLHENEEVRFLPVHLVNSHHRIASNRNMVAINGAIQVDLYGQVVADAVGGRQYSGIGGHEDFVAGASFTGMGRSLVCLEATAQVDGQRVSRIVAEPSHGATVTTPRHQVDVVITEFGVAELLGRTVRQRREALRAIAHPDFRDELKAG